MEIITKREAMQYLRVNSTTLGFLQREGKIVVTKLGHLNLYSLANLNNYVLENSDGRMFCTDNMLSTKESREYLGCSADQFRRLCEKYDFACYRTNQYKSSKTFYKFEDLKRYKDEFERIKRIKESM